MDRDRLLCLIPVKEGRVERDVQDAEGEEEIGNHRQRVSRSAVAIRQGALGVGFEELCRQYRDEELALILRFLRGANAMGAAAIAQVQETTAAARAKREAADRVDGA